MFMLYYEADAFTPIRNAWFVNKLAVKCAKC